MELDTYQMVKAFGSRLSLSRAPADLVLTRNLTLFHLKLTGVAWSRILTEYLASGLTGIAMSKRADLLTALGGLDIVNPEQLLLSHADFAAVEPTLALAGSPAVVGVPAQPRVAQRGRRGQANYRAAVPATLAVLAVPAVPGRAALTNVLVYLELITLLDLEDPTSSAPWRLLSYAVGALGPALTQAERNRPGSQISMVGGMFAAGAHNHFGSAPGDNNSLALNLKDYLDLLAGALPTVLLGANLGPADLRAEARDAIMYIRGAEKRRAVETSRIHSYAPLCAR